MRDKLVLQRIRNLAENAVTAFSVVLFERNDRLNNAFGVLHVNFRMPFESYRL